MNRERILFGLALSTIAIVLIAIVYRIDSHQSLVAVEPQHDEAIRAQETAPINAEVNEPAGVDVPHPSLGDDGNTATTEPLSDTNYVPPPSFVDEETLNKMEREEATRDVPKLYSLLLENLDLAPSEKDALERILGSYAEVQYVEAVLQQNTIPITEAQRDRMVEILIDVQNQELTLPGADAERGSIEYLEYRLALMDERQRLVFEQTASVLSDEQVRYLFEQYQRDS